VALPDINCRNVKSAPKETLGAQDIAAGREFVNGLEHCETPAMNIVQKLL